MGNDRKTPCKSGQPGSRNFLADIEAWLSGREHWVVMGALFLIILVFGLAGMG